MRRPCNIAPVVVFSIIAAAAVALPQPFGPIKSRLIALNVHDAVLRLVEGSCDLLISYHHDSQPFQLDPGRYEMVSLGQEVLAPFCKAMQQQASERILDEIGV